MCNKKYYGILQICITAFLVMGEIGCGSSSSSSGGAAAKAASLKGAAKFYNGATTGTGSGQNLDSQIRNKRSSGVHMMSAPTTGYWAISPNQLTVTIPSIAFIPKTSSSSEAPTNALSSSCTATYDSSQASATQLANCPLTVTAGSYTGVTITYNTTYTAVVTDPTNGIYSDPSQTTLLNTTAPIPTPSPQGSPVSVGFSGSGTQSSTQSSTVYFPSAQTFSSTNLPTLSVFIDPTHWLVTHFNGTSFDETLGWTGGTAIYANISGAGKAILLSNSGTTGNVIETNGSPFLDIKVFFSETTTPSTLQASFVNYDAMCPGIENANIMTTAFAGSPQSFCTSAQGGCYGAGGYLGLDTTSNPGTSILSWALSENDWTFSTYAAIFSMDIPSSVGSSTQLNYYCSPKASSIQPSGNASTYTTAPTLSSSGGTVGNYSPVTVTLLAH